MNPVHPREWLAPLLLALVIALLGSLPYLYGYQLATEDEVFMDFVGRGTPGANSYFAFSRQVVEGHTLMTNLYAPEPTPRAYFHLEWWLFGIMAKFAGGSLVLVFHLWRIASVFGFCLATYYLASTLLETPGSRRAALLLICCGAGLGWLVYGFNLIVHKSLPLSADLDGVTIWGYLINKPHFIRAGIFAALQYAWFLHGDASGKLRYFFWSGLAATAHGLVRPYHLPEAFLYMVSYPLVVSYLERGIAWHSLKASALALIGLLPVAIVQAHTFIANPLGLAGLAAWNPMSLLSVVLWLGVPFLAMVLHLLWHGLRLGRDIPRSSALFAVWWLIALLLLFAHPYFPFAQEAYFAFIFVPPILFLRHTWPQLITWTERWVPRIPARPVLIALLLLLALPSNFVVYAKLFNDLRFPDPPWVYYAPQALIDAATWLGETDPSEPVVLASHDTSQLLPRLANLRVVSGQDALSPHYVERNQEVGRFFWTPGGDGLKRWLCQTWKVDYVIFGPAEREAQGFNPKDHSWLMPIFEAREVAIYKVALSEQDREE